ncbi:cell division topological specificity factor MinE [Helicobacter pylori]|uniref:cell division topological specificity factor MinE n=1 Tax=Helicobacter pylori TaxID=210 RepID=UPI000D33ADD6|nr:cell division topological specificity factor MinE [Helicobacter pylori]MCQ2708409.1 cell division topological specificity factor MinE [Helicobacter pylori]MCQ2850794.1 cell division topological specificity factor MinE [Helicobacter pylori]MDO8146319.1 cell division topological specificity factor MinE [Helicobacter pylori]PUD88082.1 cell division topological specificity factor MinE [Helicobacter pylori]WJJ00894.1 cell division topological specificity factor MinE [Helicobacter pylori]
MSLFDFFKNKGSATTATDRLKLILAKERTLNLPYMEEMRKEIIAVIQKYTKSSDIYFKTLDSNQSVETIEVEIILPK